MRPPPPRPPRATSRLILFWASDFRALAGRTLELMEELLDKMRFRWTAEPGYASFVEILEECGRMRQALAERDGDIAQLRHENEVRECPRRQWQSCERATACVCAR